MTVPNTLVRDAVASDIDACIALDHGYTTEHVWQMTIMPEQNGFAVRFRKERLPRPIEATYEANKQRLQAALPSDTCYLILQQKTEPHAVIGYLTMQHDLINNVAVVQDVVVDTAYRRLKLGSRLLSIARRWALEHEAEQLIVETQTKNYPSIAFCQRQGLTFCGFNDQYYRNQDIAIFFGQALR